MVMGNDSPIPPWFGVHQPAGETSTYLVQHVKGIHDQSLLGTSNDWTCYTSINFGHVYEKCWLLLVALNKKYHIGFCHCCMCVQLYDGCWFVCTKCTMLGSLVVMWTFKFMIVVRFCWTWCTALLGLIICLLTFHFIILEVIVNKVYKDLGPIIVMCVRSSLWWLLITLKKRVSLAMWPFVFVSKMYHVDIQLFDCCWNWSRHQNWVSSLLGQTNATKSGFLVRAIHSCYSLSKFWGKPHQPTSIAISQMNYWRMNH